MTGPPAQVWGVRPLVRAACGICCIAFVAWLWITGRPEDRLVAGAGVLISAIATAALLTMRRRLTADTEGLTIRGPAGARRVSWGQVEAIAAPSRHRRGLTSTSVELDLVDDGLIVLSRTELGADPAAVAAALRRWWRPSGRP